MELSRRRFPRAAATAPEAGLTRGEFALRWWRSISELGQAELPRHNAIDADNDGIPDSDDAAPFDSDNDGVMDMLEPNGWPK